LPETARKTEPQKSARQRRDNPVNKRGAARLAAVQALYQMDVAGTGVLETAAEYENFRLGKEIDGEQYLAADAQWFRAILAGVVEHQTQLDPLVHSALTDGWPLSRLDSTLRAILRAGAFELLYRADVPQAVIITEYVEIATAFYAEDEPRIVNAVLDKIGKNARQKA
jgi:transcription antitermination protein NusB